MPSRVAPRVVARDVRFDSARSPRSHSCTPDGRATTRTWPPCRRVRCEYASAHFDHLQRRRTDTDRFEGRSGSPERLSQLPKPIVTAQGCWVDVKYFATLEQAVVHSREPRLRKATRDSRALPHPLPGFGSCDRLLTPGPANVNASPEALHESRKCRRLQAVVRQLGSHGSLLDRLPIAPGSSDSVATCLENRKEFRHDGLRLLAKAPGFGLRPPIVVDDPV
jgi:hypothetical protein